MHAQATMTSWRFAPGGLTWQWKMDLLKMYSLLNMGILHCHVGLLEDGRDLCVFFWGGGNKKNDGK